MLTFVTGFMTRCQSQGGWFLWEVVQMVADTTITRILLCEAVTELFQLTSMFLVVPQLLKPYFMDSSSCRKRSTGARTSWHGGPSETLCSRRCFWAALATCLWINKHIFHHGLSILPRNISSNLVLLDFRSHYCIDAMMLLSCNSLFCLFVCFSFSHI